MADLAPMTGESRAIVRLGLAELAATQRAGLRALLARACEIPDQRPTARDLAFGMAPRINAAGRIAEAELAISLLLEEDAAAAERIAEELEAVHQHAPRADEPRPWRRRCAMAEDLPRARADRPAQRRVGAGDRRA